ncbi:nuclear transcription factor Y subunit C-4-like isoform X1 [Canna indica]|uniref:Nuclear transcription factor Y subunit C-4-like isoform X1 n=1 Tax=Canna indica TaxID=4628 RepID=A0AAQ3KAJ1_9LILI|nr:nuclear transcription factor Y subunit C-4-like isoform X1 [Canna indica]
MAHQRVNIHSAPLTYDFLQVPQNLVAQVNQMHEVAGHTHHFNFMDPQKWHLQCFWQQQMLELDNLSDHKQHHLPLARIKRIMKLDGDAKMVGAETPILFAKACELFISELTVRSWLHAEQCKRHTIRRTDIAGAICHEEMLNFLKNILRPEEMKVVFMRQPQNLQQHMMPQQQHYPNNILSEPPLPL